MPHKTAALVPPIYETFSSASVNLQRPLAYAILVLVSTVIIASVLTIIWLSSITPAAATDYRATVALVTLAALLATLFTTIGALASLLLGV